MASDVNFNLAVKSWARAGSSTATNKYTQTQLHTMKRLLKKRPLAGRHSANKTVSSITGSAMSKAARYNSARGSDPANTSSKEAAAAEALVSLKTSELVERPTSAIAAHNTTQAAVRVHPPPRGTPPAFPVGRVAPLPSKTPLKIERTTPLSIERTMVAATATVTTPCNPIYTKKQYYAANATAYIWDNSVEVIVDTGSNVTIIAEDVVQKMGMLNFVHPVKLSMTVASGGSSHLLGSIRVPITLAGTTLEVTAYVSAAATYQMLLGMDWLAPTGSIIDLATKTVTTQSALAA